MSSGPENRFRESLHRLLPKTLHHEKMHNPYRGGTFDDWYSGTKADIWVEYKWEGNELSPLQLKWGLERYNEGRSVFVIVGNKAGGVLYCTPAGWEMQECGSVMTKAEIVAWLVDRTMETTTDGSTAKARIPRIKRGKRIQNLNNRSSNIRAGKVSVLRKSKS